MIKVRVKKEHGNRYGKQHRKTVNSHYELPEPSAKQLAALGLVEIIDKAEVTKADGEE